MEVAAFRGTEGEDVYAKFSATKIVADDAVAFAAEEITFSYHFSCMDAR